MIFIVRRVGWTWAMLAALGCRAFAPSSTPCVPTGARSVAASLSITTTSVFMFNFLEPKDDESDKKSTAAAETSQEVPPPADFSDDPVDKIFGFFFGQKEEAPMGMKRFGRGAS